MQNWTRLKDLKIPKKGDPMASGDSDSESDSSLSDSPTVVYSTAPTPQLAWDLEARNSKIHTHIIWLLDMIRASFVVPCLENPELLDKESEELRKNTEKNFEFLTECDGELLKGNPGLLYKRSKDLRKKSREKF